MAPIRKSLVPTRILRESDDRGDHVMVSAQSSEAITQLLGREIALAQGK
jgi:hypothetical protein